MVFSSIIFLWVLLPCILLLYYVSPKPFKNGILTVFSLFFYAWGEPRYVVLMIFSVLLNYGFGRLVEKFGKKRWLLALCVALNLLILGYFKYYNFLAEVLNPLLRGFDIALPAIQVTLPIGISFYTFQALSYVVDVYRGTIQAQKNIFHLALYISFFPQLIAGPIVKYHDVCEQIGDRQCTAEGVADGIKRFSYGLAKKMLFANTFAATVDWMMEKPLAQLGTVNAWMLAVLYTLQIYFDFSGYSDMAIGLGKMFGFDFMENFNYPYISTSIREFWRRWHISLSTWFREYLYIPLGGNRKGQVRTYVNLLIVFFATGLWHGAGATFIIWGLYHGLFLVVERMGLGKLLEKNCFRGLNHIYTALVVVVGEVFFQDAPQIAAKVILHQMFTWENGIYPASLFVNRKVIFLAVLGVLLSGIVLDIPLARVMLKRTSVRAIGVLPKFSSPSSWRARSTEVLMTLWAFLDVQSA